MILEKGQLFLIDRRCGNWHSILKYIVNMSQLVRLLLLDQLRVTDQQH